MTSSDTDGVRRGSVLLEAWKRGNGEVGLAYCFELRDFSYLAFFVVCLSQLK